MPEERRFIEEDDEIKAIRKRLAEGRVGSRVGPGSKQPTAFFREFGQKGRSPIFPFMEAAGSVARSLGLKGGREERAIFDVENARRVEADKQINKILIAREKERKLQGVRKEFKARTGKTLKQHAKERTRNKAIVKKKVEPIDIDIEVSRKSDRSVINYMFEKLGKEFK